MDDASSGKPPALPGKPLVPRRHTATRTVTVLCLYCTVTVLYLCADELLLQLARNFVGGVAAFARSKGRQARLRGPPNSVAGGQEVTRGEGGGGAEGRERLSEGCEGLRVVRVGRG
eukprot:1978179-Pyramimonas_sp.AAC.1